MKKKSTKRIYSDEEKQDLIRAFRAHSGPKEAFFQRRKVSGAVIYRWIRQDQAAPKKVRARKPKTAAGRKRGPYSPEDRRQAVEAFLKSGMTYKDFGKVWGIDGGGTLPKWVKLYQQSGPGALERGTYGKGAKRGRKGISEPLKNEIIAVKTDFPSFGLKKVRNFLVRFRGVKVSTGTIRKTVKQAKLPGAPVRVKNKKRAPAAIRYFERARPMQLWQSDITSFVLTRHSTRVYLTVFMDDHSRFVVAWSLGLQQTKEFVMEALLQGVQRFGKPEEVLTDQGRQYFSWRGRSDFQKLLDREGVRHVVSRSHHPETLGKCERFWETVGSEFWDRAKPQELDDARERMAKFIAHYNHFRPHQGIGGLVPADKFFGLESEIRKTLEAATDRNALRLALGETPRSPVFLIGQIGDQPVSMHGESGSLVIQTPDGAVQRLDYETFGRSKTLPASTEAVNPMIEKEGEDGDDDGEAIDGTGPERQEVRKAGPQEGVQAPEQASGAGEGALGLGDARAAGEGAPIGGGTHGVLDGPSEQGRGGDTPIRTTAPSLAAVAGGDLGYGGGVTDPTQNASQGGPADESGRRSEEVAKEDRRASEAHRNAGPVDLGSSRDAGLPGREHSDGGDSSRLAHDEEGTSGTCDNPSQEGSTAPEEQDPGTDGSSQ